MNLPEPVLFCWSGGKDSAMALHVLLQDPRVRVAALLTTVTEGYDRVSMHGVRRELLQLQARSIGLPLHEVFIPPECVNLTYEARMEAALRGHFDKGIRKVAFGDIFLEDLRAYREKNLARMEMAALFPIWKRDTRELIESFHAWRIPFCCCLCGYKSIGSQFCWPGAGSFIFRRSAAACRLLRREWRISYFCFRRANFQGTDSFSNRRTRGTRFFCFL